MSKRSRGLLPTPLGISEGTANHGKTNGTWQTSINKELSYSPPDSPASPSPAPDEDAERAMTATSGLKLCQSLKPSGPLSSCLRMLLESSAWYSPTVRLEWQAKPLFSAYRLTKSQTMTPSLEELTETSDKQGMRPFGCLYQLAVSERPTDETGCGLLPTIQTWDAIAGSIKGKEYNYQTKHAEKLEQAMNRRMLPTPGEGDYKGCNPQIQESVARHAANGVNKQVMLRDLLEIEDGKRTGMKLQPAFVEWMMGYPESWTELPD